MTPELKSALDKIMGIETSLAAFMEKAGEEIKLAGTVSQETHTALEAIGLEQKEIADRLLMIEQKGQGMGPATPAKTMGMVYTESDQYRAFVNGSNNKARFEIQANILTGTDVEVAPDRKPGVVPGDFHILTLESVFPSVPTTSNAIEFTKEASFTNNAAEAAEAGEKGESALTWSLVNMPISTVAHWIKISRQLAMDAPALAAYVNTRMAYGVDRRVETQLGAGDGIAPNISGILDAGNFTAHGYAAAALGATLPKIVLIRKIIGDLWAAGYVPDAILANPADAAQIDIDLFTTAAGQARISTDVQGNSRLFGVPLIQSNGITADQIAVGAFGQSGTIYNREGIVIEMSDSDDDNFTKNLLTLRAERRLALTIERPAGIIAGDLTPL
jgi:HK97 family phage major capsid protein